MKRSRRSLFVEHLENRTLLAADFSLVSIPDTQYLVEVAGAPIMNAQTDWIVSNATAASIRFAAQQGDLLRRGYSDYQAGQAHSAFAKLDGVVPYTLDIGNHDYDNQFDDLDHHVSSANFTQWFGDSHYQGIANSGFGGSSLDQRDRYQIFSSEAGGQQYMVLSLEWEAPDSAIAWAQGVINSHRQLPVILTTHEYLNSGGRTTSPLDPAGNAGEAIFNKLVYPNPQIFLVLSGHTGATRWQTSRNSAGSTVIETVGDDGGVGRFQLFQFSPTAKAITITTYTPNSTLGGANYGQQTYNFDFASRFSFAAGTIANDDTFTTPQGTAAIIDPMANDVGSSLAVASYTSPGNGTLQYSESGAFTYMPKSGYHGDDSFTYTLAGGGTARVVVRVNNAPAATDDTTSTSEGKAVVVNVLGNDTDPDGDARTPMLKTLPSHGAAVPNADGTFTYTPDPKYTGADSFTYATSDGNVLSGLATVRITVEHVPTSSIAYDYPIAESTVTGTASGTYSNLRATDGVLETIAEDNSKTLDQRWRFNVTGGTEVTVCMNAWRASGADEYALTYSTDGSTWNPMTQIVPASSRSITRLGTPTANGTGGDPAEPYQMWLLPVSTKGTVWIKAVQSTKPYTTANSLAVDELFIRSIALPAAETWRLALISDFGTLQQSETDVANMVKQWNTTAPLDAIITSGDNDQNDGTEYVTRVGNYYDQFIYGRGSASQRFLPVPGNHDWGYYSGRGTLTPYQDFFTLPDASQGNTSGNERYYNYRIGDVEVFMLDSDTHEPNGTSSTSVQAQWAQQAIQNSTAAWQIVSFHHAPYTSASSHEDATYMQWPFQEWGVDLVVNGHNHVYERVNVNGLRYVQNGVGGWDSLNGFGTIDPRSEVRYNAENGAILLTANDTTLSYQFINTRGEVIDTYSMTNVQLPNIAVSAANASEAGQVGGFTFTRSNIMTGDVTVTFTLTGTAGNGVDYQPITGSILMPAGVTSQTIPLTAINDSLAEGDETVILTINDDPAYVRRNTTATATIVDDDMQTATFQTGVDTYIHSYNPNTAYGTATSLNIDTDDPVGSGGFEQSLISFPSLIGPGSGQVPFGSTILSAQLLLNVTNVGNLVNLYRMTAGWTDASTWNSLGGGVQIGTETVGSIDASFTPSATGLYTIDVTSSLQAWLADPSSNLGWLLNPTGTDGVDVDSFEGGVKPKLVVAYASGTPLPYISVSATDADASETGDPGTFTLTRGGELAGDVTVHYTLSGSAINGEDYTGLSGSVVISGSDTSATISVSPINDVLGEDSESVVLTLTVDENYAIGTGSATVTIADDDLQTIAFQQGKDTNLMQNAPDSSYAGATVLTVDTDEPPGTSKRTQALLQFNSLIGPGMGQIPGGSTVLSATLQLNVSNPGSTVNVHRMLVAWSDSDTWNTRGDGIQADGAEAASMADASFTPSAAGLHTLDVTSALQAWSANPSTSFGWTLLPTGGDGVDFDSFEGAVKPRLVVSFAAPGHVPAANDDSYTTDEDTTLTVSVPGVLANDADSNNDPLTASVVAGPSHGTLTLDASGGFTYQPALNFYGADAFTYKAFDGVAYSAPATVTITVTAVPEPPVATDDAYTVDEDTISTMDVLANDTDPDGDVLTATVATPPTHGSLSMGANGEFIYIPEANYNGADSFSYIASDGTFETSPATVTITINAVNDLPVANGDAYSTDEDTTLNIAATGVLANDSDVESTKLNASILEAPAHGTLALGSDGSFVYTPAANYSGTDSFTYRAWDGADYSAPATVTITVSPVNDPPVAANDTYTTYKDTALAVEVSDGVLANDSDTEGDLLTAILKGGPANGSLKLNADGSFMYTPVSGFIGTDSFTYAAKDGVSESSNATVTIAVKPTPQPPVANGDAYATDEDTTLSISAPGVLANDTDPNGDPLTATLSAAPAHGTLALSSDGSFVYTPATNYNGTDSFTYTASNGNYTTAATSVTITIAAVNDAPIAVDDAYTLNQDTLLSLDALSGVLRNDSDADGDALSVRVVNGTSNGTLVLNSGGSLLYTPSVGFYGTDRFTYVVNNGVVDSAPATVTLVVDPIAAIDYAAGDSRVYGTVTGNYANLAASDGVEQSIQEVLYSSKRRSRLEHRWQFAVSGGDSVTFFINARSTGSGPDNFAFQYSLDATNWTGMLTITRDSAGLQSFALPSTTAGTLWVRVIDTDSSGNEKTLDTVSIDEMFIRSGSGDVLPRSSIVASDPSASESGDPGAFTVTRTGDASAALIVSYAVDGTATNGTDYAALDGKVTIPAGSSSATFSVNPISHAVPEDDETVIVSLTRSTNYAATGSATVTIAGIAPDTQAPTAPTNLAATATSSSVTLTWTASTDNVAVAGYDVYRDGSWVGSTTQTTYTDSGRSASTSYPYYVIARDAASNSSAPSNTVSVTTSPVASVPAAPTNLTAAVTQKTKVRLTWLDNSTDEAGFNVYSSRDGVNFTPIGTIAAKSGSGSTVQYTTGSLARGMWYFKVTAVGAAGESAPSDVYSVTI